MVQDAIDMKKILLIALSVFLLSACHNDNGPCLTCPPPYVPRLLLTANDVRSVTVELTLASTDTEALNAIMVMRDSIEVFVSARTDTEHIWIWPDLHLLPNHTYKYKAYRLNSSNLPVDSSAQLVVTTMDTTSHNFTWQIFTLGGVGSTISDVAIINDTNVIAVGEIYQSDSETLYNASRWNGSSWSVFRIPYYYQGQPFYSPIRTVLALADTDVWFGIGNLIHWNGQIYEPIEFSPTVWGPHLVRKMFGQGKTLYVVGDSGSIAFYDGTTWQKLSGGTTLAIEDIWGSTNSKTGGLEILAVASDLLRNTDRKILKISGTTVTALSDSGVFAPLSQIPPPLSGVWFVPGREYYVAGGGIFTSRNPYCGSYCWSIDPASYYAPNDHNYAVRGNDVNDVVVVNEVGDILHFNGSDWRRFVQTTYGEYYSVAIKGNMLVAVGDNYGASGVIAVGRR